MAARISGVAGCQLAKIAYGQRGLHRLAVSRLDAKGSAVGPRAHRLGQVPIHEVEGDSVLRSQAVRKAAGHRAGEHWPPPLLTVVMRAVAARQETEAVVQLRQLQAEGVGDASLEPAQRAG